MTEAPASLPMITIETVTGDLLDQDVDIIVNAWNRNLIPWWLLLPHGVSGAIKKRGGHAPFRELRRVGVLPLGGAAVTSAGRLPHRAIVHVAGIGHTWTASERSIRGSVRSAIDRARELDATSIAFPLIGAGVGGFGPERVEAMMREELEAVEFDGRVVLVRFEKG